MSHTITLSLDDVRAAARRLISERYNDSDLRIVREIGSQVDPAITRLDGRELGAKLLKLIAPRMPSVPCTCSAPVPAPRVSKLPAILAELAAMRADRDRRDADRAERDRVAADQEALRIVQAELDRAFSIKLAERDRLAVERNNAELDRRNDERIAETAESMIQIAEIRWMTRGPRGL